jgi:hypothetical protein
MCDIGDGFQCLKIELSELELVDTNAVPTELQVSGRNR